jgi:ElaB/YqjD/DUF883 family membrane-anchored ribosome-binding protein
MCTFEIFYLWISELAQLKQEARNAADALRLTKEKVEDLQKEADKKIKKDYDKDQEFIARKPWMHCIF